VPSRRLGLSLGVDIVPYKVCSLDCIYCQLGRTTEKTTRRGVLAPIEGIVDEVRAKVAKGPRPDYVTLSGSGEPTLHTQLGELIDALHAACDVPVAVLTNGTLFHDPAVRRACARADLVVPSLDAGDEATFRTINRPADDLTLAKVVDGLAAFRDAYDGPIWLEVFLIEGVNDSDAEIEKLAAHVDRIRPDRVQLNTAVRPTAEAHIPAMPEARLEALCERFRPKAEAIADYDKLEVRSAGGIDADEVLAMVRRRPVTLADIAAGLGIHRNEAVKYVNQLLHDGRLAEERRGDDTYYRPPHDDA
jgi:wyosine [tRNA(Phe)-imidazoG37] synthetase (radical SAM superfamily)